MSLITQSFESGSNGATLSVATDGQLVVAPSAGGSAVFDTAHPAHDSQSCKVEAIGIAVVLGHTPGGTAASGAVRAYFYCTAYPTATSDIVTIRNSTGNAAKVQLDTTGRIIVTNSTGASIGSASTSVPLNAQWRVDAWCQPGSGASDGIIHVVVHNNDTTSSPIYTFSSTTSNAGTTAIASVRAGKLTGSGDWTAWIDDFAIDLGRVSFIGPASGGGGGGATIVMSDDFTGTTGSTFSGDGTYANLAGSAPTYVRNSNNGKALRFAAGGQGIIEETFASTNAKRIFSRIWRVPSLPTATAEVLQMRVSAARGPAVALTSNGNIRLLRADGSSNSTGVATVPVNTDFRITFTVDPATLAMTCAFFPNTTSTTPIETVSGTLTASINITAARDGIVSAGALGSGVWLDVSWPIDTTDIDPGPRTYPDYPVVAPQANAGSDQGGLEPWTIITLTGTDIEETNPITNRTWSCITIPGLTITPTGPGTATYEVPASLSNQSLTFRYSVTASDGTTTDDAIHTILPATEAYLQGSTWLPLRVRPL
ncbi:MAG: hypothetical protein WBP26_02155 [Candidatus Saccharimonadales bacterium]